MVVRGCVDQESDLKRHAMRWAIGLVIMAGGVFAREPGGGSTAGGKVGGAGLFADVREVPRG